MALAVVEVLVCAAVILAVVGSAMNVAAQSCTLSVPNDPLTAVGLSTPFQLSGTDCDQTANAGVFVECAIVNQRTGQIRLYTPLVVNANDPIPAVAPTVPSISTDDVVALWFGANVDSVTLVNQGNSSGGGGRHGGNGGGNGLQSGACVNGVSGSVFGQVAFCNAARFFEVANSVSNRIIPDPGQGTRWPHPCPTTRSFSVVDQDQSDNVVSSYLVVTQQGRRRLAQNTTPNRRQFPSAIEIDNGSDNRLLDAFVDPALGCHPWTVVDISDPTGATVRSAQPLNELQAAKYARSPIALIPAGNPMVLNNGRLDINKLNAYRSAVNQPTVRSLNDASTATYCRTLIQGLVEIGAQRELTHSFASPAPAVGTNLFTFLAARFAATWDNLNCRTLTGISGPIVPVLNADGVATGARINGTNVIIS